MEITFETDRFNLSSEKDNFINPCCFGEDVANWLKPLLKSENVSITDIYQEDWGWEISCSFNNQQYYIGVGGLSETEDSDQGEWRVMFSKKRSILETLFGKNKLSSNEPVITLIQNIIGSQGFQNVSQVAL